MGSYFELTSSKSNVFGGNYRGFVRLGEIDAFGRPSAPTFITFDAVTSPSLPCCTWTFPVAINLAGGVVGYYNDFKGLNHAFARDTRGEITVFDGPGATQTVATGVNSFEITGYYTDTKGTHGFVRRGAERQASGRVADSVSN